MSTSEQTPVERVDQVRRYYDAGRCDRDAAIREIRAALDVTQLGAEDLLDDPRTPSARYAEALQPFADRCSIWDVQQPGTVQPNRADRRRAQHGRTSTRG